MREGELRGVQELAAERRLGDAVDGSPTTGRSIAARCTRIWCIRPVSSVTRRSACSGQSSIHLEVRDRLARRVAVERDRASGRPGRGRSAPRSARCATAAGPSRERVYVRSSARSRTSRSAARTPPASARRPSGPRCRGRGGGRSRAARLSARDLPGERVDERARSRARRPDARRARPACRSRAGARPPRRSPARRAARRRAPGASAGELDSSPPASRKLFGRATPSTSAPASTARSAAAREPSCVARKRSSRSPAAPTGTRQPLTEQRRRACAAAASARGRRRSARRAGSRHRRR